MVTDRPGNGNAASTVAPARVQLETSVSYALDWTGSDAHSLSMPTLLRMGVLSFFELRLGHPGPVWVRDAERSLVQGGDVLVGSKWGFGSWSWLGEQTLDLALSTDLVLPLGGRVVSAGSTVPDLRLLVSTSLPERFYMPTGL